MALVGGSLTEDAVPAMLVSDCVGCHTGDNTANSTTPFVMGINKPVFGTNGNTLAGGNFWWVAQGDDDKGHNVAGISNFDGNLFTAPGQTNGSGCGNMCHSSLTYGCQGCHRDPKHHADDTQKKLADTNAKLVDSAEQGWYRFLSGHSDGDSMGVKGIEHEKWNYNAKPGSHNEYLGNVQSGGDGFGDLGYTTTAFCTGCHGLFHDNQRKGDDENDYSMPWVKHPSDWAIPSDTDTEYADAFGGEYDPDVPVARTSLAEGVSSTVTPGSDMVMCLSCHVAHGSPYPDMLRWDYSKMIAGEGKNKTCGCFKCHTEKN